MEKAYVLETTYSDGYDETHLKPLYFRTLEGAKKALEKRIKSANIVDRWDRVSDGIIDFVEIEGDFPDEREYYEINKIIFEEDK